LPETLTQGLDVLDSDHAVQELLGAFLVRNYVIVERAEAKNLAAMGRLRAKWLVERY
jgi:glutamine synthetase